MGAPCPRFWDMGNHNLAITEETAVILSGAARLYRAAQSKDLHLGKASGNLLLRSGAPGPRYWDLGNRDPPLLVFAFDLAFASLSVIPVRESASPGRVPPGSLAFGDRAWNTQRSPPPEAVQRSPSSNGHARNRGDRIGADSAEERLAVARVDALPAARLNFPGPQRRGTVCTLISSWDRGHLPEQ
jgi:hypothetical protein